MEIFHDQLDVFAAAFDAIGGGGDQKSIEIDDLESVAAQSSASISRNIITLTKELDPSSSSLGKPAAAGVRAGILSTGTLGTVAGVGTNRQFFIPVLLNNKDRSDFNSSSPSSNNNNNAGVSISSDSNFSAKIVAVEKLSPTSADEKTGQTAFASCSTGSAERCFPVSNASPPSQEEVEDIGIRWSHELIDDAIVGACIEIHRSVKNGVFAFEDVDLKAQSEQFPIEANPNTDVFGQPLYASGSARAPECKCPECNRPIAASRYKT